MAKKLFWMCVRQYWHKNKWRHIFLNNVFFIYKYELQSQSKSCMWFVELFLLELLLLSCLVMDENFTTSYNKKLLSKLNCTHFSCTQNCLF